MEPTSKPTISQLEANWHVHLAGMRAEAAARATGVAPDDSATLLDAASGGIVVGGINFPPIHGGFMLMLSRVEDLAKTRRGLADEMGNLAALALILGCPQQAWAMLREKNAGELFEEAVTEFAMQFTLPQLKELMTWVGQEMERIKEHGDSAGKPLAE